MGAAGIKHASVGNELSKTEWESATAHVWDSGASFPASPNYGDKFFRHDTGGKYFYSSQARTWKELSERYMLGERDFIYRVGTYRTWYFDKGWGVLEHHSSLYASGEYSEGNSSMLSYDRMGYGTYEWRLYEVRSGSSYASGRSTYWGFQKAHGKPDQGLAAFHHDQDGVTRRIWTSDGTGDRQTTLATKTDWTKERIFKIDWQSSEVKFYIDGTIVGSHAGAGQIPNASLLAAHGQGGSGMHFLVECAHVTYHAGVSPTKSDDYTKTYFNFSSFKRVD